MREGTQDQTRDHGGRFWGELFTARARDEMIAKYEALAALEALAPGPQQDRQIRAAARRWPGSLRESQLAGPQQCARRLASLRSVADAEASPRASWRDRGVAAVPLWAELHALLGDQLRWRTSQLQSKTRRRGEDSAQQFLAFVSSTSAAKRWPSDPDELSRVAGSRVRSRQAYLWLAARAGLALPAMQRILFARSGHWERREGDPGL